MARISTRIIAAILVAGLAVSFTPDAANAQQFKSHTVKSGDTLYRIARANFVTVESLRRLNDLDGDHIEPGQVLWIDGRPAEQVVSDSLGMETPDTSVVSQSDSMAAELPDSSELIPAESVPEPDSSALAEARPDVVDPAQSNTEPSVDPSDSTGIEIVDHVVSGQETLYSIADQYGLSIDSLARFNEGHDTFLSPGDTVRVPWGSQVGNHTVSPGETLYRISRRYNTSVNRIQEMNNLEGTSIRVGQQLVVPLRPDQAAVAEAPGAEVVAEGLIRIYPEMFEGRLMANGRPYIADRFTASHDELALGTTVVIVEPESGRSTFAEITDRLPVGSEFVMEVSTAIAVRLGLEDDDAVIVRRAR